MGHRDPNLQGGQKVLFGETYEAMKHNATRNDCTPFTYNTRAFTPSLTTDSHQTPIFTFSTMKRCILSTHPSSRFGLGEFSLVAVSLLRSLNPGTDNPARSFQRLQVIYTMDIIPVTFMWTASIWAPEAARVWSLVFLRAVVSRRALGSFRANACSS